MSRILSLADTAVAESAAAAVEALQHPGAVVLVPTETVYGLICRAQDAEAVQRIYDLKDRDSSKPLAWFIADWRMLPGYGVETAGLPERLAKRFCPGAITIIAPKTGGGTVGFRIPDHPLVLEILRRMKCPLASTSANHSGHPNALTVAEALAELTGEVNLAIDGGAISKDALASTVVDATGQSPKILRQGPLQIPAEL